MCVTATHLGTPYNDFALKHLLIVLLLSAAFAQTAPTSGQTVLAIPF
jgi:hypothetical protein